MRRPRIGSVLLTLFVLLLAAGVVKRAESVAEASERVRADLTLFDRYATGLRGTFPRPHIRGRPASDLVCAPFRPLRAAVTGYGLCVVIGGGAERPRLVRAYRTRAR